VLQRGFAVTLQFATAAKLLFTSVEELIGAALNAVGFNIRFTNDLLEQPRRRPAGQVTASDLRPDRVPRMPLGATPGLDPGLTPV
jgi:hypothetical protein